MHTSKASLDCFDVLVPPLRKIRPLFAPRAQGNPSQGPSPLENEPRLNAAALKALCTYFHHLQANNNG